MHAAWPVQAVPESQLLTMCRWQSVIARRWVKHETQRANGMAPGHWKPCAPSMTLPRHCSAPSAPLGRQCRLLWWAQALQGASAAEAARASQVAGLVAGACQAAQAWGVQAAALAPGHAVGSVAHLMGTPAAAVSNGDLPGNEKQAQSRVIRPYARFCS